MNPKTLHNLTFVPFLLLGITAFLMGFGWMLSSEPWMLDESANTILLQESYKDLFAHPINQNLPKYLTLLYRFFGLWVTTVGMLITSFTIVTRLGTTMARGFIQISFFILKKTDLRSRPSNDKEDKRESQSPIFLPLGPLAEKDNLFAV